MIAGTGWQEAWDSQIAADSADLKTAVADLPDANSRHPMNGVTWYEASAFCAWDGGWLPTEAEWEYAAAGGSDERKYPWGSAEPSATLAAYDSTQPIPEVGSRPAGAGRYGQLDLAGSVPEWALDDWGSSAPAVCNNCAVAFGEYRGIRSEFAYTGASALRAAKRFYDSAGHFGREPSARAAGFRCARTP